MLDTFIDRIRAAHESRAPLIIQGGGSKTFYGNADEGEVLSTRMLTGVVAYQPKELVLTARAGAPLAEIEALLAGQNQMLAFEPPHFGEFPLLERLANRSSPQAGTSLGIPNPDETTGPLPVAGDATHDAPRAPKPIQATLGGSIAAGLSGPRRPYAARSSSPVGSTALLTSSERNSIFYRSRRRMIASSRSSPRASASRT